MRPEITYLTRMLLSQGHYPPNFREYNLKVQVTESRVTACIIFFRDIGHWN